MWSHLGNLLAHDRAAGEELIVRQFVKAGCTISGAAAKLDVHEKYLHRLVNKLNLRPRLDEKRKKHRKLLSWKEFRV